MCSVQILGQPARQGPMSNPLATTATRPDYHEVCTPSPSDLTESGDDVACPRQVRARRERD